VHLLYFLLAAAFAASAQTSAIRNATIIDVTTGTSRRGNIVITGSKIAAAGPVVRIPAAAKTIDGTGKFVIPGLWDMHVHLWASDPMFDLYTAYGVTGVRDMGSKYEQTRAWARQALAGIGPKVFTSGAPVDGPSSEAAKFPVVRVAGPDDGRRAADSLDTQGVDFITVLSTVSRDAYTALSQRARLRRAILAGHVPESVTVATAIDSRQRSMEHLFGVALACSSEEYDLRLKRADAIAKHDTDAIREVRQRTYDTFSESKCVELFRRMARFGVWQTPTLTLRQRLAFIGVEHLAADVRAKSVPKAVRESWKDPTEIAKNVSPAVLERLRADYDFHSRIVGLMNRNRVDLLAGTDTGDDYVVPGAAVHDELALMVDAGLAPADALRAATWNAARYFNLELTHGTIERGKTADLVILDADPLTDIRNTKRIRAVVVRGKLLDRKRLDAMLAPR
jgi:hypothetical protein